MATSAAHCFQPERVPSICIVDDTADFLFILQQIFSRFYPAYSVHSFASGQAFLAELPQLSPKPRLILMDRYMPESDAHQTLIQLKKHEAYKLIPVVIMSVQASSVEIENCYAAHANSFMLKPLDFKSLTITIGLICQYWLETDQCVADEPLYDVQTN